VLGNIDIETKLYYVLPPFENFYQEPQDRNKIIFMSFQLFSYGTDASGYTRIYACIEGRDVKLLLMLSCFAKLLEHLQEFAKF
jgi:hypothetical protein